MKTQTNRNRHFLCGLIVLCFISCDSKREHDSYVSIPNKTWEATNNISFPFIVNDTINKKNLFITLRNNKEYPYSNLFLIAKLEFPNGEKVVDTLEYEMADASGKFLGSGFTDIKESKLFYKEDKIFPVSGKYVVTVSQAMRKNGDVDGIKSLEGITDVGFRIEKKN